MLGWLEDLLKWSCVGSRCPRSSGSSHEGTCSWLSVSCPGSKLFSVEHVKCSRTALDALVLSSKLLSALCGSPSTSSWLKPKRLSISKAHSMMTREHFEN
eukprot:6089971-Amphidinium_carterae.1